MSSSENNTGEELSSYESSDADDICDDERNETYMFDHPIDSDDEIEAKYL